VLFSKSFKKSSNIFEAVWITGENRTKQGNFEAKIQKKRKNDV